MHLFCVLCVFAIDCSSLAPNEDIVRFRCGAREVAYLFAHLFCDFFKFFLVALGSSAILNHFLISNGWLLSCI